LNKQIKALHKFRDANPDIIYCYFPIEFPVVDDGVRDMDEDFRSAIDTNIKRLMSMCGIQPIYIRGSVEDRITKVTRVYNWLTEGMYLYTSDSFDPQNFESKDTNESSNTTEE
jgi:hypothetical protein